MQFCLTKLRVYAFLEIVRVYILSVKSETLLLTLNSSKIKIYTKIFSVKEQQIAFVAIKRLIRIKANCVRSLKHQRTGYREHQSLTFYEGAIKSYSLRNGNLSVITFGLPH